MDIKKLILEKLEPIVESLAVDLRKALVAELAERITAEAAAPVPRSPRSKIRPCIAPGCTTQSKGPRFHYLCEQHKNTGKRTVKKWRDSRRELGMEE